MGNILSSLHKTNKVTVPTSLEELLETQVISEAGSVEEDASKSPWILAFLQYPGMRDEDKRQMLFFRLLTSRLLKTKTTELDGNRRILLEIQRRYFSDSKFQQPSISFTDIHNVVPQIFRLFDTSLQQKKDVISVRAKLVELSEDESIRAGLRPSFCEFIKRPSHHPLGLVQTCKNYTALDTHHIMQNGEKFNVKECVRLTSIACTSDQQDQALQFLLLNKLPEFTDLVNTEDVETGGKDKSHWINASVKEEGDTLLEVAIKERKVEFVKTLLRAGAGPDLVNPSSGLAPVHLSVRLGLPDLLSLLLASDYRDVNIRTAPFKGGLSPLHLAAETGNMEIIRQLLEYEETDIDIKDGRGVQTPLLLAIKNSQQAAAIALIENGASLDIMAGKLKLRDHFRETFPQTNPDHIRVKKARSLQLDIADKIFTLLKETEVNGEDYDYKLRLFKSSLRFVRKLREENKLEPVFDLAVKKGLHEHVDHLLQIGAEINTASCPLLEAAYSGHFNIIKLFKKRGGNFLVTKDGTNETVLHLVLKMKSKFADKTMYEKCLEELLVNPPESSVSKQVRRIINKVDSLGNTPLHLATNKWPQTTVRRLLEAGANIGIKNHWKEIPVTKIRPDLLESFLSEHCLVSEGDVEHEDFSLTFRYDFLAPDVEALPGRYKNQIMAEDSEQLVEAPGKVSGRSGPALPETEPLWYMSQSKQHRHLLRHPVITSFLWFKWQKIRKYFNRNLRFTFLFVFILTWFTFKSVGTNKGDETSPLIWYFASLGLLIILFFFVLKDWFLDLKNCKRDKSLVTTNPGLARTRSRFTTCCNAVLSHWIEAIFISLGIIVIIFGESGIGIVLGCLLGMLVIREVLQMSVSLKRYLCSLENWVELTILTLATFLLLGDGSLEINKHLGAFAIVLSWAELIVLLGQHPKLREYNIYVTMFFKVMKTFFLFLTWYFLFIIAFGLGFYILLHKDVPEGGEAGQEKEEEYKFFDSVWLSLVKTATMLAGELEFSDIPIDLGSKLAPLAYIFFLSFVFLIVIVLFNLLNGLAVSDTGLIRDKAEIFSYRSQVETISTFESMLLGDPFDFLSNVPSKLSNLPSCSLLQRLYGNSCLRQLMTKLGAGEILLFYQYLESKSVTITPNRQSGQVKCLSVDEMGQDIIAAAKDIIIQRENQRNDEDFYNESDIRIHYKNLQSQVKSLESKIELILKKLN